MSSAPRSLGLPQYSWSQAKKSYANYNSIAGQHAQALGVIVASGECLCVGAVDV